MKSVRLKLLLACFVSTMVVVSSAAQVDHTAFSAVLGSHVRNGMVDYAGIKRDKRFAPYLASLSATAASTLTGHERLAFWINVYNAFTIKLICDNFPLKSIRDLSNGKVWDRPLVTIDHINYSLNEIENDVIRPLGDHRIHFALVCAARSCPPLRSEAYRADILDAQLRDQAERFLADQSRNTFDTYTHVAKLSHVFEWYLGDFGRTHAQLLQALQPFLAEPIKSSIKRELPLWTVQWMDYDWSLNGK